MTQKRAIKLMMSVGIPRNMARLWLRNNSNTAKFPVKWVAEDEIWATKIWGVPKTKREEVNNNAL